MSLSAGGLEIPTSQRGTTGLLGVSYSPEFQKNGKPFIASINRNDVEKLDPRLTRDQWPWGGDTFHIGEFPSYEQAAYARADFIANAKSKVDSWIKRGGRSAGPALDFKFPDLSSLKDATRDEGIRAAYDTWKNGGSEAEIAAAAESKRLKNVAQVQKGQANISAEETAVKLTQPGGELNRVFSSIPPGKERGLAMDFIKDELTRGTSVKEIEKDLADQMYAESVDPIKTLRRFIRY